MTLREALDRTLRLMRDEIDDSATDDDLIAALTGTKVAIVADAANLASHSAQTAFVTVALLLARSGHQVYLLGADLMLLGHQPPIEAGPIITSLMKVGADLLPGISFSTELPDGEIDFAITLGDSKPLARARHKISLNADDWSGALLARATRWKADSWPVGGMVAAALAASEAFKIAMKKLQRHARNPLWMASLCAPAINTSFAVAPPGALKIAELGEFDCVSGGALVQASLYVLSRLPGVTGHARVIEPDYADISNLNRYALLLKSHRGTQKAEDVKAICAETGIVIEPIAKRYEPSEVLRLPLRPTVLIGVDDIPSRWLVQRARPEWLAVGATTHWSAMGSSHNLGKNGCAQCLHPVDDPGGEVIPTVAFVSFLAGVLTAAYFLRYRSGDSSKDVLDEQIYVTPLRPENPVWATVPIRPGCPTCGASAPWLPHSKAA